MSADAKPGVIQSGTISTNTEPVTLADLGIKSEDMGETIKAGTIRANMTPEEIGRLAGLEARARKAGPAFPAEIRGLGRVTSSPPVSLRKQMLEAERSLRAERRARLTLIFGGVGAVGALLGGAAALITVLN